MPDFEIRPLKTLNDFHAAEEVQRAAWDSDDIDVAPLHIMLTIAKNGGVALGAFAQDQLVGFVLGFLGTSNRFGAEAPATVKLKHCSHMLGVLPEWQSRGVGYALKVAQREAVLNQGVRLITWTYDPLESRNARLNIAKLGAVCTTYIRDYYGELRDDLNRGLATDRFQVDWWIASRRIETRLTRQRPPLQLHHYLEVETPIVNPARWDDRDLPVCQDPIESALPDQFLVEFPADFRAIRHADNALAVAWRLHLRSICEAAFASGYAVIDYVHTPGQRARSFYVMLRIESSESSMNA
jgi:predicted GNAT superfamily acetyltransferase